jgi:hypothetical protein
MGRCAIKQASNGSNIVALHHKICRGKQRQGAAHTPRCPLCQSRLIIIARNESRSVQKLLILGTHESCPFFTYSAAAAIYTEPFPQLFIGCFTLTPTSGLWHVVADTLLVYAPTFLGNSGKAMAPFFPLQIR